MIKFIHFLLICFVFASKLIHAKQSWIPKILWTYWEQKIENDNHMLKIFQENHKIMLKDWQIRHLNKDNVQFWVNQIPDFNGVLNRPQFKDDSSTKRANLIRIALIKHFGGVWMDYTIILTKNLNWLLNLKQQPLIQNIKSNIPQVFLLYSTQNGNLQKYFDQNTGKQQLLYPTLETFFIAAKPKSRFAQQWFQLYVNGKHMTLQKYGKNVNYQEDSWLLDTAREQNIITGKFNSQYFQFAISAQIILQRKQKQLDEKWLNNPTRQREYATQLYDIWYMPTGKTASIFQNISQVDPQNKKVVKMLMQSDIKDLKHKDIYPNYLVKLFHFDMKALNEYLLNKQTEKQVKRIQDFNILQNSIGYQFLLKKYPIKFYTNKIVRNKHNNRIMKHYPRYRLIQQYKQQYILEQEQFLYRILTFLLLFVILLVFLMLYCQLKLSKQKVSPNQKSISQQQIIQMDFVVI